MNRSRWLLLILGLFLVAGAIAVSRLPELVRRVAVARIHALTQRPVSIDRVELNLFTGRASIQGVRLGERDGQTPFADFARLDVRVRWLPLFTGRLHIGELALGDSTVRVVRRPDGTFNFSDLVSGEGGAPGRPPAVTVDRFVLTGGTVTLEDRALPRPRTWRSERITIEARDLSTLSDGGQARATSITEGSPVVVDMQAIRLHPVHLQASVTMEGLDLALARVYLPPDARVVPERGRVTTSVRAVLDARDGLRADLEGRLEDVVLAPPDGGEPLVLAPRIVTALEGFAFTGSALRLARLSLEGAVSVRDPLAKGAGRFRQSTVRTSVADLTWPATTPGRLDVTASVPGGGTLAIAGALRPPPDASDVRLRLSGVSLASWAQFMPIAARVTGIAEADLRVNEPLGAGIPTRVRGTIAVNRLAVADERHEVLGARRVEASGIELHPAGDGRARVAVGRVLVSEPRGTLDRDRSGAFRARDLLVTRPVSGTAPTATRGPAASAMGVEVGEIVVRNGALTVRDETVASSVRLDFATIDATVRGIDWPLRGAASVRVALRPPGGGRLQLSGRVGLDPPGADLHVVARDADLAPYRPYLHTRARLTGRADLDLAVVVSSLSPARGTARGRAALSRVDVRDGERTVLRLERGTASGIDVDWPERVTIERVALTQPWVLIERDDQGQLALRTLVDRAPGASSPSETPPAALAVAHLSVEGGGMRVVDQSVSPPFAVDLQSTSMKVDGLSTAGTRPARLDLSGRLGPGSEVALRGTLGPLAGPLRLDVNGELRDFVVPRANPYLVRQVGWKSTEGRVTSKLQCRVDGDALSARTDIRLSGFHVVRAASSDGARSRIGLPLGMLTSLMKNRQGDIDVSLPIGGRLDDPRFDFSEAIWGAVRAVAINAITLPVSWIGRVRFTGDSRIERIEVDPVPFEPGTPTPAAEGQAQVTRLAAFLDQLPEVRMSLTPVVSSGDVEALRRRAVEAAIADVARQQRLEQDAAAARLFAQRFPGQAVPPTRGGTFAALLEAQAIPPAQIDELGARRLRTVLDALGQAGIDTDRLGELKVVQHEGPDGRVEADVLEPEGPRPSRVREILRRLGVPLKGGAPRK
jgi:hypothetical protein